MDDLADSELHAAVRYEDVDAVQTALSKADCRVNQIGLYRWAPLHEAASGGFVDIVRLLLAHGADPNLKDALSGSTAVHYAARDGHIECLRLLLDAGGRYDVADDKGETAFDAASSPSRSVLESRRILDLTRMTLSEARKSALRCAPERAASAARPSTASSSGVSSPLSPEPARFPSSESVGGRSSASSSGCSTDPSSSSVKPRAAWLLRSLSTPSGPSVAILHASFEYHSKKRYLKVRVSKLSNVNLVSGHSSSIGAICVKCRLEPEDEHAKKNSKRKTEEVKVQPREKKESVADGTGDAALSRDYPSSFAFTKPLEYLDIDEEVIRNKNLRLEVCVSHRITRKSYVVGDVTLPLRVATAKLLKEAYPVRPCPYADAPHGMRVLTASAAAGGGSGAKSESDPDLRLRSPAIERLLRLGGDAGSHRASSDTQLRHVTVIGSPVPSSSSSVSIDMPDDGGGDIGEVGNLDALDELTTIVTSGESHAERRRSPLVGRPPSRPKTAAKAVTSVDVVIDGTKEQRGQQSPSPTVENDRLRLREVKVHAEADQNNCTKKSSKPIYVAISMTPIPSDLSRSEDDAYSVSLPGDCVEIPIENSDV